MVYRSRSPMRPEEALDGYGPRFGEYPVQLMTRRTYSLQAESVIDRRETAPNSVWVDGRTWPGDWNDVRKA